MEKENKENEEKGENMGTCLDIDTKNMSFIQALIVSSLNGCSFTNKRYSLSAKNSVQYYVRNNQLFCQNEEQQAEIVKSISSQKMSDMYEVYEGNYEQYHSIIKADVEKFERLKQEIEPLYSLFKEYERLKTKLMCFDDKCIF